MFKKHVLNNTLTAFLLVFIAGLATMFYSSCKPEAQEPITEKSAHQADIDADLKMILEHQATGNSVFFQDADKNWVENPSEEWLKEFYNQMASAVVDRSIVAQYRFSVRPASGAKIYQAQLNMGAVWIGMSPASCMTSGNTYTTFIPVPAIGGPSVSSILDGSGTCSVSGRALITLKRYNSDLSCYCTSDFSRLVTFNQPTTTTNLGNYACGIIQCDF